MDTKVISNFFSPKKVVVIGASPKEGGLGLILMKNLLDGGIKEENLFAVNPKYKKVLELDCYHRVADLPAIPDLAVIVSPAKTVTKLIDELGRKGTRTVIVISAGFSEGNNKLGEMLQEAMLVEAEKYDIRILGPNSLGIISPYNNLNASFSHLMPEKGNIGVISQSGAMLTSIIDWASGRGIGFSHLVSLGDSADISFPEMLDFMASDHRTDAILIYMESIQHARRFISAARATSRVKPVFVLKVGRSNAGRLAAVSHTGSLAGSDEVYDAAFNRCGLLREAGMRELFYAASSLTAIKPIESDRLAILTNGGGMGVLATDTLMEERGRLAILSDKSMERLNAVLPISWSHNNPVDIIGDADEERYSQALKILFEDEGVDAVLILNCPTAITSSFKIAEAVVELTKDYNKCLITSWVGNITAEKSRNLFAENNIPTFATPESAVNSFMHVVRYKRNQKTLMQTPPALAVDLVFETSKARGILAKVISEDREWLNEMEAHDLLDAYGIPTVTSLLVKTPEEAAEYATKLGFPVVLKIFSPDILHKSDVRGVALNLSSAESVKQTALDLKKSAKEIQPDARIDGFIVQKMIDLKGGHELILGIMSDKTFGPVLLFGQGGTAVEILNDKSLALPPLNLQLAKDMISRTAISKLLEGYRDHEPINMDELLLTLIKLSQMAIDLDHIAELDINPLLVNKNGVIVLDTRIRVSQKRISGADRLAIRPYPQEFEELLTLKSGDKLQLRPIRPEDEPALIRNFEQLTKEEVRFRFFHVVKTMDHNMAARLTQIDYDREMALVVTDTGVDIDYSLYAVVRLITDPSGKRAEFALIVNHSVSGQGLGTLLMHRIITYGKSQHLEEIYGEILSENKAMIAICRKVGFTVHRVPDDMSLVHVKLDMNKVK